MSYEFSVNLRVIKFRSLFGACESVHVKNAIERKIVPSHYEQSQSDACNCSYYLFSDGIITIEQLWYF